MKVVEIHGRDLREALERASVEVGREAVVIARHPQSDGSIVLEVRPPAAGLVASVGSRGPRPGTADVERFLQTTGASSALIDRVCEAVAGRLQEDVHPLDLAAEEIGLMFPVARISRSADTTHVFAFLGGSGAGKTTALLKWALRLRKSERRFAVAWLEGGAVGSTVGLQAWAREAQVPCFGLRSDSDLALQLQELPGIEILLLDTTGRLEQDVARLTELTRSAATTTASLAWSTALVLPATSSTHALEAVSAATAALQPTIAVLTKLDETRFPGTLLEHVLHANHPVAFLCDSCELMTGYHRAAPEHFADLLLSGRIRR